MQQGAALASTPWESGSSGTHVTLHYFMTPGLQGPEAGFIDLKLRGFPLKHRRVWLVEFEAQKVLAWRLLLSRFSVLHIHTQYLGSILPTME
jgi:hypothetical protein